MNHGDPTRLFVLAHLRQHGPSHGHQLRREARLGRTEQWSDVRFGSIYSTLRRLEAEGLVAVARSEREGRFPERTVYEITAEGVRELKAIRDRLLHDLAAAPDPFDLAFSLTADLTEGELRAVLEDRLVRLEAAAGALERQGAAAAAYLDARDGLLFDHAGARLAAEIAWHRAVLAALPSLETRAAAEPDAPSA